MDVTFKKLMVLTLQCLFIKYKSETKSRPHRKCVHDFILKFLARTSRPEAGGPEATPQWSSAAGLSNCICLQPAREGRNL